LLIGLVIKCGAILADAMLLVNHLCWRSGLVF